MSDEKPKPRHIFAFDPGEVNIGFAYFKWDPGTKKADTKIMKILNPTELDNWLKVVWGLAESPHLDTTFVIENFRIDGQVRNKVFQWSEVKTIRVIGKVELVADWTNSKRTFQEPTILGQARKWSPWKLPRHIPDDKSAWLHGVHYMMKLELIRTTDDVTMFGQDTL